MADEVVGVKPEPKVAAARPVAQRVTWLWQPNVIVFVSSACIMVLELIASRVIAPVVGSSLYTWTTVIGVVLAGITIGNYVGGRLADRWASLRFLGVVYVLAAFTSLIVFGVDNVNNAFPADIPILTRLVLLTIALFFLPCAVLGMISPIVVKLTVSDLAKTGSTVGKIYAAGALGSIVGTFATGFFLISWFGSLTIVMVIALILLAMGAAFILGGRWIAVPVVAVLVAGGWMLAANQGWTTSHCARETNYYCISVVDGVEDNQPTRQLILDHLVHSFVSLNDPKHLVYPYEKSYAEAADYQAAQHQLKSVLMIGGGGYTFPRYLQTVHPETAMHVVEIDPEVTKFAYDELALPRSMKIQTFNEDARLFFARPPNNRYDLILGDAFNYFSVPYHLTTKEFNDRVRQWLAPDGLYIVNIIDGPYGEFVRAYYNTLRLTFTHVYLAEGNSDWRKATRSMFLLIGSDVELDNNLLAKYDAGDGDALLSRMIVGEAEINRLLTEAPVVTLTDDYVPVDQMLASVFREEMPQ